MDSLKIKESIKQAGLTDNETTVYQSLLELGPKGAGTISRRTGLHRRVIYDVMDRLIKKGLIGYIVENNRKLFRAANPQRLLEIIEEQKNRINETLPDLMTLFSQEKEKPREDTMVYKGKNGLKSVFEDQIEQDQEVLILGASPTAYDILQFYFNFYDKKRKAKKMFTRIIFSFQKNKKIPKIPLSEIRFLPEKYSSPLSVNVYSDRTAIIFWDKLNPLAIVIKSKDIAEGYRKYFEMAWKSSKKS